MQYRLGRGVARRWYLTILCAIATDACRPWTSFPVLSCPVVRFGSDTGWPGWVEPLLGLRKAPAPTSEGLQLTTARSIERYSTSTLHRRFQCARAHQQRPAVSPCRAMPVASCTVILCARAKPEDLLAGPLPLLCRLLRCPAAARDGLSVYPPRSQWRRRCSLRALTTVPSPTNRE